MSDLALTYRGYAERAQADADAATLENVRERNQRAAEAWKQMAERQERTDRGRAQRENAAAAARADLPVEPQAH
ncbi:hypothetical protein MZO42_07660 [Sphingomonas psychrotolerans]|uniref:Uncharacterized protein n=1 Tax=Sphingomonas psychrotolerans TaxID=1327635 RepID=A0ABU3N5H1_9SPHN|nr:hypothetical protein [Sphingomonas psychrotolerans]MDT8758570.1 hypothetical protein [Sphingomonas psychrotolerans]